MGNDGSSAWKSVDVSGGPWIIISAAVTLHAIRRWQTSCRLANIRASNSSCTSAVAIAAANQLHRPRRTTANIRTSNSSCDISSSVMIGWVYYLQQQPSSQLVWQKSVFVSFLFRFESWLLLPWLQTNLYRMNATNKATAACCAFPIGLVIKPPLLLPNATKYQLTFPNGLDRMPLRRHRSRKESRIFSFLFVFLQFVSGICSLTIGFAI